MSIVVDGWPALDLEDIRHVACDVGLLDYDTPLDKGATVYLLEQRAEADRRRAEADAPIQGPSASRWMLDRETRDARERADRTCVDAALSAGRAAAIEADDIDRGIPQPLGQEGESR